MSASYDVLIVGAGLSGLVAARELQARGKRVLVLDKSRGVGGRMATRRVGEHLVDHGAPYFQARGNAFVSFLNEFKGSGVLRAFSGSRRDWGSGELLSAAEPLWLGSQSLNQFPKTLAEGLELRLGEKVTELKQTDAGWELYSESGSVYSARAVMLACPAPQSLALAQSFASAQLVRGIEGLLTSSCWTAIATAEMDLGERLILPWQVLEESSSGRLLVHNSAKLEQRAGLESFVLHFGRVESEQFLFAGERPEELAAEILAAQLPAAFIEACSLQLHLWRFARFRSALGFDYSGHLAAGLFLGGDWVGGSDFSDVEGAYLSGVAAAAKAGLYLK